jgi:hypothetical protein
METLPKIKPSAQVMTSAVGRSLIFCNMYEYFLSPEDDQITEVLKEYVQLKRRKKKVYYLVASVTDLKDDWITVH